MSDSKGHDPNATEDQAQKRLTSEAAARIAEQEKIDDIKWLMRHKEGRRIVQRVLEFVGVSRIAFRPDAREEAFTLGMQNAGFAAQAEINAVCPKLYITMLQENTVG